MCSHNFIFLRKYLRPKYYNPDAGSEMMDGPVVEVIELVCSKCGEVIMR